MCFRHVLNRALDSSEHDVVGVARILADPAFLYKLAFEQLTTISYGVYWEVQHRGERYTFSPFGFTVLCAIDC